MLERIQNDLFDLGADLCVPAKPGEAEGQALRIQESQVERLEREIDALNAELKPLDSFVLPGGAPASGAAVGGPHRWTSCPIRRRPSTIPRMCTASTQPPWVRW